MYKIWSLGISSKFLKVLKNLYTDNKAAVWGINIISNFLQVSVGFKTGMLFFLFLNDLEDELNGQKIKILFYADDAVILAQHPGTLQKMINKIQTYCETWNLTVIPSKSKMMIFYKGIYRIKDNLLYNAYRIPNINHTLDHIIWPHWRLNFIKLHQLYVINFYIWN